jgi:hypothetical protein
MEVLLKFSEWIYITDDVGWESTGRQIVYSEERIFAYKYPCSGRENSGTAVFRISPLFRQSTVEALFLDSEAQ